MTQTADNSYSPASPASVHQVHVGVVLLQLLQQQVRVASRVQGPAIQKRKHSQHGAKTTMLPQLLRGRMARIDKQLT